VDKVKEEYRINWKRGIKSMCAVRCSQAQQEYEAALGAFEGRLSFVKSERARYVNRVWSLRQQEREALEELRHYLTLIESLEAGAEGVFVDRHFETPSTVARFELEGLRRKCGQAFDSVFGPLSLVEGRCNPNSIHHGDYRLLDNQTLYKAFIEQLSKARTKAREVTLYLDRNYPTMGCVWGYSEGFKSACLHRLFPLKVYVEDIETIRSIFKGRKVDLGGHLWYAQTKADIDRVRKRLPSAPFADVANGLLLKSVEPMPYTIALPPTYIHINKDGAEVEYYEPRMSRSADAAFVGQLLAGSGDAYKGVCVQRGYVFGIPCTIFGLIKPSWQVKSELYALKREGLPFSDVRDSSLSCVQESIKESMRSHCLQRVVEHDFGGFHAPSVRDLVDLYGVSKEIAVKKEWFVFFHKPVRKLDYDRLFGSLPFALYRVDPEKGMWVLQQVACTDRSPSNEIYLCDEVEVPRQRTENHQRRWRT